ncbi:uncharacterized protein LOC116844341 isoform X1 [Odontomachus brunneus]|uniref:uncharacterized protein LOC116844341 isoform X1 n=1 Tax=Odontomachus brunneus TaxID=486640 RepID=UPI0013F2436D|nr:uncharacterized protein LOC116844341 isoform X1 [Odontomachus brunneus]
MSNLPNACVINLIAYVGRSRKAIFPSASTPVQAKPAKRDCVRYLRQALLTPTSPSRLIPTTGQGVHVFANPIEHSQYRLYHISNCKYTCQYVRCARSNVVDTCIHRVSDKRVARYSAAC